MADPVEPEERTEDKIESLRQALAFFLEDNLIDRFEADGLKTLILQDGQISEAEKAFLQEAITHNNFDSEALSLLKELLQRQEL
ncbi:hypothetical protein [Thermostichus vulcanus]|uniref:Uncharacterized protein n=1 Tax=Thermostichus vulcanus str. 'Rupite' TaxID=2813851 RepID=A0ABT0C7W6_THEVL|nr:hypothetical protein [Thermostichus vulcanus]MCJ2541834.1 hypothetical protein [Thermostichus vulcanus str. 'Rupite']